MLHEQTNGATIARTDTGADARPYARLREERPDDQVYTGARGEVHGYDNNREHLGDAMARADEVRALQADALALASAVRKVDEQRRRVQARLDRLVVLSPDEVTGILALCRVTGDMLKPS